MPRSFVAIAIDAAVVERLAAVGVEGSVGAPSEPATEVSDAAPERPRGTWRSVKPAAMHLTLALFGDVDETRVPDVLQVMAERKNALFSALISPPYPRMRDSSSGCSDTVLDDVIGCLTPALTAGGRCIRVLVK